MNKEDFLIQQKPYEITECIYPIRKRKIYEDYVMIFLEEEKIMISVETYFRYGLKDLQGLDEELYQILKKDEKRTKAYRSCLRKLSARDHTVKQIRDHLSSLELEKEDAEEIIGRLSTYGLLDDEKYCVASISRHEKNSLSVQQIRRKLAKDGIDEELIGKYVTVNAEAEAEKASVIAARYAQSLKNRPLTARKRMTLNKLLNCGFSYEIGKEAVAALGLNADQDLQLLEKEYRKVHSKYERKYAGHDLQQHVSAALYVKGFRMEDIRKVMEE